MAQYEHLPIYKQTYDILLRTMVATKDFPREYKFTLGQKIKDELIELVTPESLEPYYHMPNVARRLLENFLAFKMPNVSGELHRKVEDSTLDATKKTSIVRFLHTHSHEDQIGHGEHDSSILAETPQIMKLVLELIAHEDKSHYDRMMALINPPSAADASPPKAAKKE